MKTKKIFKIFTITLLALALCMNFSISAFAATLSGYGHRVTGTGSGSFDVNVSGSYSTAAGMTLKTSSENTDAFVYLTIKKPNGDIYRQNVYLEANEEVNIQMLFVNGGTYTISYQAYVPSGTTHIECWIYA